MCAGMFEFAPAVNRWFGKAVGPLVRFLRLRLHLTPNQVSLIGAGVGMASFVLVLMRQIEWGLVLLVLTEFIDGLDGAMARRFNMETELGKRLELIIDRGHELLMFLAFVWIGEIRLETFLLAYTAIILMTILRSRSGFDPDFKRKALMFGYFFGFDAMLQVTFLLNLAGFMVSLVILDLREDTRLWNSS